MNKRYLKTLIALAALAVLWGVVAYVNRRPGSAVAKTESPAQEKIFPLKSKDIQSFTLAPRGGQTITCAREEGNWAIVKPELLPADATNVDGLLNSLTDATVDQVVASHPADLKDFGLDSPAETVEVESNAKPEKFTLLLGDQTPTGDGIYAQIAGNPRVITLASYMKDSIEKSLFDLRDKRALTIKVDQVQRIQVAAKGKSYTLIKNPEGVWDLQLPPAVRADHFTVSSLVDQLRNVSMQSVLADNKKDSAKYGLSKPTMTVRLSSPGGAQTLVLGKKDGDRYDAMNSELAPVFTLNSDFYTQLDKGPESLRAKDLFSFSTFEVKRVEINSRKGHWVLEEQNGKWKETAPSSKDEPNNIVQTLLDDLHDLTAQSFPAKDATDLAAYGLVKPAYRFQVEFGEKNQTETVEIAKKGKDLYARRATDAVPSQLAATALDSIEKSLGAL